MNFGGRFESLGVVAAGGMARVHRAVDRLTGATVAVKELLRVDDDGLIRFERECVALARVVHPGVVRYLAHGVDALGDPWLVMEWLEGADLSRTLAQRRGEAGAGSDDATVSKPKQPLTSGETFTVPEALTLARRIGSALAALHEAGLVHRDVKPANIFLQAGKVAGAKLLDLGIARDFGVPGGPTAVGTRIGTLRYMSPEQARGDARIGPASDIFSLGSVVYECLAGSPPFAAPAERMTLARLTLDPPVPLEVLRDDIPEAFLVVLRRMLAKDPAARFADGAALCEALSVLSAEPTASARVAPPPRLAQPAVGAAEEFVRSALLVRVAPGASSEALLTEDDATVSQVVVQQALRLVRRLDGNLALVGDAADVPVDEAARMARAALALREAWPAFAGVIITGRRGAAAGADDLLDDRGAALLAAARDGEVLLDGLSATLLESRFDLDDREGHRRLCRASAAGPPRLLLGKPTRTVGRRREIALLETTWADCVDEARARVVLITGAPGLGKSRLARELASIVARSEERSTTLVADGDPLRAGSPFVMLASLITRFAQLERGRPDAFARLDAALSPFVPDAVRGHVAALLAEAASISTPPLVERHRPATRMDPTALVDGVSRALDAMIVGLCQRGPVLLILEDLHWGDALSVRALESVLASRPALPLLVAAFARPEVHLRFPGLFRAHGRFECPLEPLSPKAALELARVALGPGGDEARLARMVERAAGNAFHLEEMIRAAAEGQGDGTLPESVLGMVQGRLARLAPGARRILRAASVLGEETPLAAVEFLCEATPSGYSVREWLDELVHDEHLDRIDVPGGVHYRFRHALVRDAAYAAIPRDERPQAHLRAAEWLEASASCDPRALAAHLRAAGETRRAARALVRVAEAALDAGDLDAANEAALEAREDAAARGAAEAILAAVAYWQSRYEASAAHGLAAIEQLPRGSARAFEAGGSTLVSLARISDRGRFSQLLDHLATTVADDDPAALTEQLIALARGTFQQVFAGRYDEADALLARLDGLSRRGPLDARAEAQLAHVRGVRAAMVGDAATFYAHLQIAVAAFARANDLRNVVLETTTLGWCQVELGHAAQGVETITANLAAAREARAAQAITYAKVNLGYALAEAGRTDEAFAVLGDAIEECARAQNARLEGWARGHRAALHRRRGDHPSEARDAQHAAALLTVSPSLRAWALAASARALSALGRPEEALPLAEEASAVLHAQGGILQGGGLVPLALAEALAALGRLDEAARHARSAAEGLRARAAAHGADAARLFARTESRETLALARRLSADAERDPDEPLPSSAARRQGPAAGDPSA